ncbi:hypothetical protein NDU88_006490 [Pleurodeles waltl]|uniref:Myb/SANT-like DNA-binding domain-containing protein n=1 Tax=Pleurodeles waltl TaxID=8319 RepID=A0AAV7MD52_PLEWA|nr:hypothetical protein NDU88_006490 [Pleurodeles waltl]
MQHTHCQEDGAMQTIVNRVNAVGYHPHTRDDIRKRWNNLQRKVRAMASRHHISVQKTGRGPPPTPPDYTDWEEKVLAILHPEGLTGLTGGMDSGGVPDRPHQVPDVTYKKNGTHTAASGIRYGRSLVICPELVRILW